MQMIVIKPPRFVKILILLLIMSAVGMSLVYFSHYESVPTAAKRPPIERGNPNTKEMVFTVNVYWGNEYLPRMLEILKQNNVKATFFLGGQWVEDFPDLAKELAKDGHEIGNHGYCHAHHRNLTLDENRNEIAKAERIIQETLGVKTTLFAPPYGEYSDDTLAAADALGYKTILWTIDTVDWDSPGVETIIRRVVERAENGAFVLMHPTAQTVEALPEIIRQLKEKGFSLVTVSEALHSKMK